ncbi:TIGR02099 family protein [Legionella sp. MW5194]|nr:TIGR02099 family protein [Legionella sp. MW5194]
MINAVVNFFKRIRIFLAAFIIVAALLSSLFRALTPWATQYKSEVEQHLSTLLGEAVTIQSMETGWYWFEPVIKLNQVTVTDAHRDTIKLRQLFVGINLFSSLWHWQIQPGVLYINDVKLTARQRQDQWQIDGLTTHDRQPIHWTDDSYQPILAWILAQQKIIINHLSLDVHLNDGTFIPARGINLVIGRSGWGYRIKAKAHLRQQVPTALQWVAYLTLDPYHLDKTEGQVYLSLKNVVPAQWQGFFNPERYTVTDGRGDVQVWTDIKAGQLQDAQARADIYRLALTDNQTQRHNRLDRFKANLAWQLTRTGWQLSGDHVGLEINHRHWPQNQFLVAYQKPLNTWTIHVKQLIIESLLSLDVSWPDSFKPWLAVKPRGLFKDTRVQIKNNAPAFLLTQFKTLGWEAFGPYPGVENLSGVLSWQPNEGHVEIDGEYTVIKPKDKPPVTFLSLNTVLDWKELSHGLRISLDRLVLRHPDLLFSGNGVLDDVTAREIGHITLTAALSASKAQRWLLYLPSQSLKPKLDAWLKHDVKRIDKLVANVNINGRGADFPYDKAEGEFEINGHLSGVDLVFAPKWPVTKDIEAYVQVKQRTFNADVVHADLQGIVLNEANVVINNLGLNRETLLVHTKVDTSASKAQSYVLASPLNKKLSALNSLQMSGSLSLDLQLEAALYPENDDILALGDITFKNNQVKVNHTLENIELHELNGSLQFDHEGVLDSSLQALLLNNPVSILIQSIRSSNPRTEVRIKAKTNIALLRGKLNLSIFELMRGDFWLEGLLVITENKQDLDQFQIKSSLSGLKIDLPPPLNKTADSQAPLTVDIHFNPDKALRFRINYDSRLSADLWFSGPKGQFHLQKGEIRLGSSTARWQEQLGLQIVGSLASFDLRQWLDTLAKLPATRSKESVSDAVSFIDLRLKQARIAERNYTDLAVQATRLNANEWSIEIEQQQVKANLRYKIKERLLSGVLGHLYWHKSSDRQSKPSRLNVSDMPNVDLRIHDFRYDTFNVGQVALKMTRSPKAWRLDYCKIKTPAYQVTATGEWHQATPINQTQIKVDMQINDLAGSLKRWHISPVVESSFGQIELRGTWPGSYTDFALNKVKGTMALYFKHGRITNLSPETEEKLGLGKLLSILSLQTIPRRLKLDFSDLKNDGYSFDVLKGSFEVRDGAIHTTDSYIDGPVAYASMKGSLDLARQLYDVDLQVSPHITASLPIVATIAGGPVAGVATWVASKIINQGMQKIRAYTYKISGPWKQPVVQQVSIFRKEKNQ